MSHVIIVLPMLVHIGPAWCLGVVSKVASSTREGKVDCPKCGCKECHNIESDTFWFSAEYEMYKCANCGYIFDEIECEY